ncbi:hypothetical protein EYB26_004144 [Talaromyces marneffei]|nr:uncharacterized protein EYB26_004144 [Talaromyces marneffei]QGA16477.1 hypothetical protein EYB26_004144 [Talaromyces marneffei]
MSVAPTVHRQKLVPMARSRLRVLQEARRSVQNLANGRVPSTPLKHTISCDSDGENASPYTKSEPTKRKRSAGDDGRLCESPKSLKASRMSLVIKTEDKSNKTFTSSAVSQALGRPIGRDSQIKSKPSRAFGRRSQRLSPIAKEIIRKNVATSNGIEPRRKAQPASWSFEIHVDTEVEEATNLMQHSADRLDISDDEGKARFDECDKENIPPHELGIALPATAQPATMASRKNMMAESRSPLGELDASDYYGPGLGNLSYEIIQEDEYVKRASAQSSYSLVSAATPSVASVLDSVVSAEKAGESCLEK